MHRLILAVVMLLPATFISILGHACGGSNSLLLKLPPEGFARVYVADLGDGATVNCLPKDPEIIPGDIVDRQGRLYFRVVGGDRSKFRQQRNTLKNKIRACRQYGCSSSKQTVSSLLRRIRKLNTRINESTVEYVIAQQACLAGGL